MHFYAYNYFNEANLLDENSVDGAHLPMGREEGLSTF